MKEINEKVNLLDIGSNVKINLSLIKDRIHEDLKQTIIRDSVAKIIAYKITDGTDIGFLLELNDGSNYWFFKDELSTINKEFTSVKPVSNRIKAGNQKIYTGNNFSYVLNPINFSKWLILVTSDFL